MRWSSDSAVTASILFVCARCKCVVLVVTYQTKWFCLLKHSHIAVHNKSGSADALKPSRWWSVCRWDICVWKKHKSALKRSAVRTRTLLLLFTCTLLCKSNSLPRNPSQTPRPSHPPFLFRHMITPTWSVMWHSDESVFIGYFYTEAFVLYDSVNVSVSLCALWGLNFQLLLLCLITLMTPWN